MSVRRRYRVHIRRAWEENAGFMMCLEQSNKIKFILTRHEHRAAFMAEIYGRLTGNPAGRLGFGGIPYTLEDMQIDKMLVVKSAAL